jgi:hypothetical protein
MKIVRWIVLFGLVALVVGGYLGYTKYAEYRADKKVTEEVLSEVKESSLRINDILKYELSNTGMTYGEQETKIKKQVDDIDKRMLDIQSLSTPRTKKNVDIILSYLQTGQNLLKHRLLLTRALDDYQASQKEMKAKIESPEIVKTIPADCLVDKSLLK